MPTEWYNLIRNQKLLLLATIVSCILCMTLSFNVNDKDRNNHMVFWDSMCLLLSRQYRLCTMQISLLNVRLLYYGVGRHNHAFSLHLYLYFLLRSFYRCSWICFSQEIIRILTLATKKNRIYLNKAELVHIQNGNKMITQTEKNQLEKKNCTDFCMKRHQIFTACTL